MNRRSFLKSLAAAPAAILARPQLAEAALPKAKITRVRIYRPPNLNQTFNQSDMIVTVETDIGITGIGEGGLKDTLEQCAGTLIGNNPFQIEALWQEMFIAWFYPPGREKIHAQGALDLALWDIKGKALGLPVHQLLGGAVRKYCECYATAGLPAEAGGPARPQGGRLSLKERARATIESGYRAFRMGAGDTPADNVYNTHQKVRQVAADCKEVREGVGKDGDWCIDFHQRFELNDAIRACRLIEEYEPYFVEDPVRDEFFLQDIPKMREMTTVPLTAGEEWGGRHDFNKLVENHDIDYIRATPSERRRHYRNDEDRRPVRNARGRHHSPLHRAHRDGRFGELPVDVPRPGDHGIQLRRPSDPPSAGMSRLQGRKSFDERPAGSRA